jgi:prevent-host-death family protein
MDRIGVRELRQEASKWLRRVKRGESFEVTEHGTPVALLVPLQEQHDPLGRLAAAGQLTEPAGDLLDYLSAHPPVPPAPGVPAPSALLEEQRAEER